MRFQDRHVDMSAVILSHPLSLFLSLSLSLFFFLQIERVEKNEMKYLDIIIYNTL